jgi:ankyrin repeat protein
MREISKYCLIIILIIGFGHITFSQSDSIIPNNINDKFTVLFKDSTSMDSLNDLLLLAADSGKTDDVISLLLKGANVNAKNLDGVTPLMYASQNGFLDIIKILVYNGADINAKPIDRATPLIAATRFNHDEVIDFLIQHGAFIEEKTNDSATALIYAVAYGYFISADMLIFYGADVNTVCHDGSTPLIIASFFGNKEITELLISYGANLNDSDKNGWTALHSAVFNNHPEVVKTLVEKGANINQKNNEGYTALAIAAEQGYTRIADTLIKHGADASIKTYYNLTPYKLAMTQNKTDINKTYKDNNIKKDHALYFNNINISLAEFNFNTHDFLYGLYAGINDPINDMSFYLGLNTRLCANRTLVPIDDNSYYQFWERRSFLYLNAEKIFKLKSLSGLQKGIFIQAKALYTYGKYRASKNKPDDAFHLSPAAGFVLFGKLAGVKAAFEYLDIKVMDMPKLKFSLSFFYTFHIRNNYTTRKEIQWL